MKTKMFTVYDVKANAYLPPFHMQSVGEAHRSFEDTCNTPDHPFNKHPTDYTLFEVGTFDDNNCKIEMLETPHPIALAIECISTNNLSE